MLKLTMAILAATTFTSAAALAAPAAPQGVSVAGSVPALDKHDPIAGKEDRRIRTFPYDPNNTMRLTTPGLSPVRIVFSEGAVADTIAGALVSVNPKEATNWSASDAGNTLLLQPLKADLPPSILFVTTKGSEHNNYVIELHVGNADPTDPNSDAYIQVSYTYPAIATAAAAEDRARVQRVVTESKIRTSITQARFNAPRQWHYSKKGADCATMTPSGWNWLSDDGHQTTLLFPPHMAVPSFFSREDDDTKPEDEALITPIPQTTAIGTLEVLPDVYRQIVLRRDHKACALRADRFDPIGTQPGGGSGTISPDVIRVRAHQAASK